MNGKRVYFTEDEWTTTYEGVIYLESLYSYYIVSFKYGDVWIPKENVIVILPNLKYKIK
jgi:hypothetical protein